MVPLGVESCREGAIAGRIDGSRSQGGISISKDDRTGKSSTARKFWLHCRRERHRLKDICRIVGGRERQGIGALVYQHREQVRVAIGDGKIERNRVGEACRRKRVWSGGQSKLGWS